MAPAGAFLVVSSRRAREGDPIGIRAQLERAIASDSPPSVVAYNRIDGPGSSLDLRAFQQALWRLPSIPKNPHMDPSMVWSRGLPRTVGMTIGTGTRVVARPYEPGRIAVQSKEYGTEVTGVPGEVVPLRENWLLRILDLFDLSGVMFSLENLEDDTHSAGLGGSATATTGVCILANELAGRPFGAEQLVSVASTLEHDLGVSITGTQEQANVLYGGVVDYAWFPWGIPGRDSGFGASTRTVLLEPEHYGDCEARMTIFHSGRRRASSDVNAVWTRALSTPDGYKGTRDKAVSAYEFREGLRLRDWARVSRAIADYRHARANLAPEYLTGSEEIVRESQSHGCEAFPLGAGGGGSILVFGAEPVALSAAREVLAASYREIPVKIRSTGHELFNLPRESD